MPKKRPPCICGTYAIKGSRATSCDKYGDHSRSMCRNCGHSKKCHCLVGSKYR